MRNASHWQWLAFTRSARNKWMHASRNTRRPQSANSIAQRARCGVSEGCRFQEIKPNGRWQRLLICWPVCAPSSPNYPVNLALERKYDSGRLCSCTSALCVSPGMRCDACSAIASARNRATSCCCSGESTLTEKPKARTSTVERRTPSIWPRASVADIPTWPVSI